MCCNLCSSNKIDKKFSLREFDVFQCKECNLMFLSQIPGEEELKKFYSWDYYREREEYFFDNIVNDPENGKKNESIEAFSLGLEKLKLLKPEKGRILDVGCGPGIFLHMAKEDGWNTC